jgi:hypothetical protein
VVDVEHRQHSLTGVQRNDRAPITDAEFEPWRLANQSESADCCGDDAAWSIATSTRSRTFASSRRKSFAARRVSSTR